MNKYTRCWCKIIVNHRIQVCFNRLKLEQVLIFFRRGAKEKIVGGVVGNHSAKTKMTQMSLLFVMMGVRTLILAGKGMSFYRHMSCNPELRLSLTAKKKILSAELMLTAQINAIANNL